MKVKKRVRIYQRVSRLDKKGEGESLPSQHHAMLKTIKYRGWDFDGVVYEDKGISAWSKKVRRLDFEKMLLDAQNKEFDILIIYRLDRLSRKVIETINILERLKENGVEVYSVCENLDTTSPMGKASITLLATMAQYQSDQLSVYMKRIFARRTSEGKSIGGTPTVGYKYDKKTKKIGIDTKYIKIVRRMFKLFDEDKSYQQIAGILNREYLKTPTDCRWRGQNIGRILSRYEYTGRKLLDNGKVININYPKIITDKKLFDRVQTKIVTKSVGKRYKKAKGLLSGKESLARCGICGNVLGYHGSHSSRGLSYYVCNQRFYTDKNCSLKYIRAQSVELIIDAEMSNIFCDRKFLKIYRDIIEDYIKKLSSSSSIKNIDLSIGKYIREKKRLIEAVKNNILPDNAIREEYRKITLELNSLEHRREQMASPLEENRKIITYMDNLIKMTRDGREKGLSGFWKEMSFISKRFWIKVFYRSIKLYPDKIKFEYSPYITADGKNKMTYPILNSKMLKKFYKSKKDVIFLDELLENKTKFKKQTKPHKISLKVTKKELDGRAGLS